MSPRAQTSLVSIGSRLQSLPAHTFRDFWWAVAWRCDRSLCAAAKAAERTTCRRSTPLTPAETVRARMLPMILAGRACAHACAPVIFPFFTSTSHRMSTEPSARSLFQRRSFVSLMLSDARTSSGTSPTHVLDGSRRNVAVEPPRASCFDLVVSEPHA